jgi:hypothetical protein
METPNNENLNQDNGKVYETHYHYPDKRINSGSIFFGLFLVFIGFIYLGKNLGLISVSLDIREYWPVLLILLGLSLLKGRGLLMLFIGILIAIAAIGIIGMAMFYQGYMHGPLYH